MKKRFLGVWFALLLLLCACQKEPVVSPNPMPPVQTEEYRAEAPAPLPQLPAEQAFEPSEQAPVQEKTCTLSVRCDTIWKNAERMDPVLLQILPADGVIYPARTGVFSEGESVFDLLERELRANAIPFEFSRSPMYDSVYIEGIGNLYEFDCGERSGWIYRVNGQFPNYACSRYLLQAGDVVEWVYTCDLGADIGR